MLFKFIVTIFFLVQNMPSFGKAGKCKTSLTKLVNEMNEWENYDIKLDPRGVVKFPSMCTPFMKSKAMIPLVKRKSAGVNRERYLGSDCFIYEWDSQHGAFEIYRPNSQNTDFYHAGESSAVFGEISNKVDPRRNNNFTETGLYSLSMKELCKKHQSKKIEQKDLDKLLKYGFNCL